MSVEKTLPLRYKQEASGGLSWADVNTKSWNEMNSFSWFEVSRIVRFVYEVVCTIRPLIIHTVKVVKDYIWRVRL